MTRRFMPYLFVGVLVLSGPLAHTADRVAGPTTEADLEAAIAKAPDQEDASRSAITSLQGDQLQRLSLLASDANGLLAGGDPVVSVSLVAALLIVIIVILVAR